jgi:hypothetical protein
MKQLDNSLMIFFLLIKIKKRNNYYLINFLADKKITTAIKAILAYEKYVKIPNGITTPLPLITLDKSNNTQTKSIRATALTTPKLDHCLFAILAPTTTKSATNKQEPTTNQ